MYVKPLEKSKLLNQTRKEIDALNRKIHASNRRARHANVQIDRQNRILKKEGKPLLKEKPLKPLKDYPYPVFQFMQLEKTLKRRLEARSPAAWIEVIERLIPNERRGQVANIVWWDFFGHCEKPIEEFTKYAMKGENQTHEQTIVDLAKIGYSILEAYDRVFFIEPIPAKSPQLNPFQTQCLGVV